MGCSGLFANRDFTETYANNAQRAAESVTTRRTSVLNRKSGSINDARHKRKFSSYAFSGTDEKRRGIKFLTFTRLNTYVFRVTSDKRRYHLRAFRMFWKTISRRPCKTSSCTASREVLSPHRIIIVIIIIFRILYTTYVPLCRGRGRVPRVHDVFLRSLKRHTAVPSSSSSSSSW